MAIYHTHISSGSRDDGQSAAVKVAYILREGAYGGRHDLVASGSGNMPAWASPDPRRLFEAADLYERANGRLFVHVWVALPNELNASQRHLLVVAIATALTEARLPYVYAIHAGDPKSEGEPANPHAHLVISERVNDGITRDERQWFKRANRRKPAAGGAAKDRSLKELTWVEDTRKRVEELTNEHLCRAGRKERVTADSHAKRIAVAEAEGDQETAEYLRRHPPGIHLGPAAAAMERNRYRGKQGEEPELARPGEPTDRGNLARAKEVEKEHTRRELERVSKDLCRAREKERCATASVALARSVWLSDAEILGVYKESESVEAGTGWVAITGAAALLVGRKDQAEASAESFGIDVEAVVRGAHARDENAVAAVERATGIFQDAQSALMTNEMVVRIQAEAGASDAVSGWGAVAEAARTRLAWKARTESAARKAGIGDIDDIYTAARSREEDPLSALVAATAEREHQGRIASEARAALLTDAAIARIRREAEASEPGSDWAAVEAATVSRQAQKEAAEAGATTFGLDIEGVYAGAQAGGADPVVALGEKVAEEERLASERRAAIEQREGSVAATKQGRTWLLAAQREALGSSGTQLTLEQREKIVETVYQRLDEALGDREAALRSIPEASQYLPEVVGGAERLSTLAARESMVMTAEQRLGEELDDREWLVKSAGRDELLVEAFCELCDHDTSFGNGSSLPERWRIITLAKQWHEEDLAEDAERSVALDALEAMLKETSSGAQHLAAAQQEVLAAAQRKVLGEGKEPATLNERDSVVSRAWRRVEQELDGREEALASRRCEDGPVEVSGAWLYAIKLAELEAGQQQNDGPSPGCREQALAWAAQQMDRLDALRQEEALDLFFGKLVELEPARGLADIAEEEPRAAAARRQDCVDALSEDELVFVEEKRDALDPQGREAGPWKPAHVDAAVDYTRTRVVSLDEEIEGRRTIIEETPGDGYARLLAAGFGEASRQQKLEALTVMETDLAENFARREERIRTDVEGEEFLRRGRLLVLEADREAATLAERGRIIDQAERLQQEAKREAEVKRQAEQERETRRWKEKRDASVRALDRLPGGRNLYHAYLADLDPAWDPARNKKTTRENIDAALDAAASDSQRLGHLRDVLANPADAACYRAVLEKRGERFSVEDIDAAVESALRRREEEANRQREEEEKRERKARARRAERIEALSAAGRELYTVHLMALTPAGDHAGGPSGAVIDRALEATESDARLPRLEAVFRDAEHLSYYRAVLSAAGDEVTLQQIDEALEATETFVRRKQTVFGYPGNSEHLAGGALYAAALESRAPGWRPGAEIGSAVLDEVLMDVESQLAERVRQAADAVEELLPTTQPHPNIQPGYRIPALCNELLDGLVREDDDAFFKATVAALRKRYQRRAGYDLAYEERYDDRDRRTSQQAYLQDAVTTEQSSSARPSWSAALATVLKKYLSKIRKLFRIACDKVLGGDLGERLVRHREQVRRAADAAGAALPAMSPWLGSSAVPAVSDETLMTAAVSASTPFVKEVAIEVGERYKRQARYDTASEERYDHNDRRQSEKGYLHDTIERRRLRSPRSFTIPSRVAVEAEVFEEHRASLLEVFEVACDEVVGRGDLGKRVRQRREQVSRVADAVVQELPTTTQSYGRVDRHVPAVSDETLAAARAGADPFLQEAVDVVWDRYDQCADYTTPSVERYDADDRRRSEEDYLAALVEQALEGAREAGRTSARQAARERVVKDHRSRIRGIFTAAHDEVLRSDELQDQREQSVRLSESGRAGDVGTSRRAASESLSTPPGQERTPHGGEQRQGKQQERAGPDSTTGQGGKDNQGERPRTATMSARPAAASVTEADRVRLAAHLVAKKLPRTQPYASNSSHRPPALSDERFNRLATATDDEFVRKVIAGVQKEQTYYTDFERARSEEAYLRQAIGRKHQEALDEYEKAEAKRWSFSRRSPKPTWAEVKAAAIEEFESKQLVVIEEVCDDVQHRMPGAVRLELQRRESGRMSTPSPSQSRTRTTNQRDRGDSGFSR